MTVEADLVTVLKTQCPRVFPDFAPFATPRPYVFWQFVGGTPIRYLDNTANLRHTLVQITAWSDGRAQCNALIRSIEAALCSATAFRAVPRGELIADADPESERFGASQDFDIWSPF